MMVLSLLNKKKAKQSSTLACVMDARDDNAAVISMYRRYAYPGGYHGSSSCRSSSIIYGLDRLAAAMARYSETRRIWSVHSQRDACGCGEGQS